MGTATIYPHLSVDEHGIARISGSRYKVLHLAGEHYHYGWSAEELLRQHPDLKPEEVYSALTYFYDHYSQMVSELSEISQRVQRLPADQTMSREELMQRRKLTEPS